MADDSQNVPSRCAVSVLLQHDAQTDAWGQPRWRVIGILPEPGQPPEQPSRTLARDGAEGRVYLWRGLILRLNPTACDDYVLNLSSERPMLFIICQSDADGELRPINVSADQQDGVEAQEFGETMFAVAMPHSIAAWLEQYTYKHWRPGPRKKPRWKLPEEDVM